MRTYTFILVHGPWQGAWCWRKITPLLRASGHRIFAPDLPGHGLDPTPSQAVTFRRAVERVSALVERASSPVILVGHSLSGPIISQVAEAQPSRVALLVYLAALLPSDGESAMEIQQRFANDQVMHLLKKQDDTLLYHDCPEEDIRQAHKLFRVPAQEPLHAPVTLSQRFEGVPRASIICTQDRVISPAIQQQMAETCNPVIELPSGHSPFFALPRPLAECLLSFALFRTMTDLSVRQEKENEETLFSHDL